jgi:D-3-phosphoglycerate dehydrogenase / 2-oxoglutarate reductase
LKTEIKIWKILIADVLHPLLVDSLRKLPVVIDVVPEIEDDEFLRILPQYHGVVLRSRFKLGPLAFEKAKNLRFIARGGAGIDGIDLESAEKYGIDILTAAEGNSNSVAEHCLGLIFGLIHNLFKSSHEVKQFEWLREENRGIELADLTVGILGYGNMGRALGKIVSPLCKKVIAYDILDLKPDSGVEMVDLESFRKETQVLSIHIQMSDENRNCLDLNFLSQFRDMKFLINTSRGEVLDLGALETLLGSGKLLGAGLDVLSIEQFNLINSEQKSQLERIFSYPSVVVTPHIAGWSIQSFKKISRVLMLKIQNYILQNG